MTASEFLQQLERALQSLQAEERENAMAYYREYFEEAGQENETQAAESLGSPQSVAERIISETGENCAASQRNSSAAQYSAQYSGQNNAGTSSNTSAGKIIFAIVMILLTSPFWIAVPIVWFTIVFLLVFLPLVFAFAGIAAPIQAIFSILTGNLFSGLWDLGGGLFMIGFTMLIWYPCVKLAWLLTKLFGKMCVGIWRLFTGKEKNV